jgi:hypothetical protein
MPYLLTVEVTVSDPWHGINRIKEHRITALPPGRWAIEQLTGIENERRSALREGRKMHDPLSLLLLSAFEITEQEAQTFKTMRQCQSLPEK